ncbi:uncharacterized protein PHALS_09267 [Plasmopara halstedii]|uniref:Uncharacterized protein n=1 Tax=Plasmopara halstedii TaxID=4781 RepID=A0A0P1ADV1_PLAHL|nr:uncharacterized protein PHALS_09267 [Plasmopara halstedii]CEG39213.1 hypothetical protein PHALS_09267 [Plasmopara halstedii]|eukprot:XP_024575582.1 hypothetical protein PHALS_09267 [Plasmopara halstedii]
MQLCTRFPKRIARHRLTKRFISWWLLRAGSRYGVEVIWDISKRVNIPLGGIKSETQVSNVQELGLHYTNLWVIFLHLAFSSGMASRMMQCKE